MWNRSRCLLEAEERQRSGRNVRAFRRPAREKMRKSGLSASTRTRENANSMRGGGSGVTQSEVTAVRGDQGDCLIHCGQQLHGGGLVSKGTRFLLVCFFAELRDSDGNLHHERGSVKQVETPCRDTNEVDVSTGELDCAAQAVDFGSFDEEVD